MSKQFTDLCFVTKDVLRLCAFYESVFGGKAEGDEWRKERRYLKDNLYRINHPHTVEGGFLMSVLRR